MRYVPIYGESKEEEGQSPPLPDSPEELSKPKLQNSGDVGSATNRNFLRCAVAEPKIKEVRVGFYFKS